MIFLILFSNKLQIYKYNSMLSSKYSYGNSVDNITRKTL